MKEERLINSVRCSLECPHEMDDGWCPMCGYAESGYQFSVGRGDRIVSALNGVIFEHNGRMIWYADALDAINALKSNEKFQAAPKKTLQDTIRGLV